MPRISPWQRPLIAAALVLGLGSAVQAQSSTPPVQQRSPVQQRTGEGPRLTEAQRQKVFPATRSLAAQDHRARIVILQQGERCISAATNGDGLRNCMRQEREALQNQRKLHRDALRQVFVSNGIAVPDWSQRKGGPSPRAADGGYGWDQPGQPAERQPLR